MTCTSMGTARIYGVALIISMFLFGQSWSVTDGEVRLRSNASFSDLVYGRVEVYHSGQYGTICNARWGQTEANVVCRQLGYAFGTAVTGLSYGQGAGTVWLSSVSCSGSEATLADCHIVTWGGDVTCGHDEDAAVVCYRNNPGEGDVRLAGTHFSGRVELFHNGVWGTVSNIDRAAADVICRQLHYDYGKTESLVTHADASVPVHASRVRCSGPEAQLSACAVTWAVNAQSSHNHSGDAGVVCFQNESPSVRLAGGGMNYGRVEVQYNGIYGSVCDTNWDYRDAKVICNMLGLSYGKPLRNSRFGGGKGIIWLNNVNCQGSEAVLTSCSFNLWATNLCDHNHDAAVYCSNEGLVSGVFGYDEIRLSNGSVGYVEIRRNNTWGGICDDGWSDRSANVACKELGYKSGRAYRQSRHGIASRGFWLDYVQCTGQEPSLSYCLHSQWTHDCFTDETASVECFGTEIASSLDCDFEYNGLCNYTNNRSSEITWLLHSGSTNSRLRSGPTNDHTYENAEGHYIYVEASANDEKKAQLISPANTVSSPTCLSFWYHMFGYDTGHLNVIRRSTSGVDEMVLWQRSGPQGNTWKHAEIQLPAGTYHVVFGAKIGLGYTSDMALDDITVQAGQCKNTDGAHIGLYEIANSDPAVRVEANGKWRFICFEGWDYRDAVVACKELGYQYGRPGKIRLVGSLVYSVHQNIRCTGSETSLTMCKGEFSEPFKCRHNQVATVGCTSTVVPTDIYLVGGSQPGSGRVEVVYNGVRGTICDDHFDDNDATIICRRLGYVRGKALRGAFFGPGNGSIVLDELSCYGLEPDVNFCGSVSGQSVDCDHSEDASVVCYNTTAPTIPGATLCDFESPTNRWCGFTQDAPNQIIWKVKAGLTPSADTGPSTDVTFGSSSGHYIYLEASGTNAAEGNKARIITQAISSASPKCLKFYFNMNGINIGTLNVYRKDTSSGLETKLFSVSGNFGDLWYPRSITLESGAYSVVIEAVRGNGYRSDIAVDDILIQDGSCRDDHPVRLRGGDGSNGRVEVRHLGKWVTVCDETFDYRDARVLCRQIGYQYGKAVPLKPYGEGTTKWQMTNIDCEGEDNDVMQCRPIIVRGGCPHSQDSAVQCGDDQSSDVQLRLAGGSSDYGRVEVMYNGTWGTICDHYWSDENAKIVCKQLGYSEGKAYRNARFGIGSGPIWLSGVRCVGEEPVIDFCNNMQWGEQSCDHFSDASVACTSEAIQRFSTTIDCEFETEDNRLCGYTNVSGDWILWAGPSSSRNSGLSGPAHDHTKGTKTGGYMAAGAKGILKDVQYLRSPPVTITTSSCLQFYYHMFGQSMGSLNVYINRTSNHQATRVMSADGNQGDLWKLGQVNLTSQGTYIVVFEAVLGEENKSVIGLDDVSLTEGACQNRAEYGSVRLAPDDGAYYGRLEVYYGGSWGSVCDDGWDDNAATVVCRMLGYQHGKSYVGAYFGQGFGIIMLDDVQCSGHEGSLPECSHGQWAHTNCDHGEDAGVWCYDGSNAPPPRKGDVRLRNGNQTYEGLIEVYNAGYWGTVCSLGWDILDSTVMCSALGFSGAVSACNASSGDCHGQGSGDIWLSNVQCNGTETAIDQCPHDGWGGTPCTHDQDVGIVCKTKSCAPLLPPPFATVYPATCSLTSHPQQTTCNTTCQQGYILQGSETHRCQKDGIWSDMTGLECVDGIPPTLTCPQSIVVTAARGHTSATASWADPQASDNLPGAVQISQSLRSPATFGEGVTHVYVNATDKAGNIATCSFTVEVQVKRCPNLTLPRHAHVKDECRSHWGAVCTIGCATGYTLAGNEYVICEAHNATTDTNWGPITGACNIVQCSELPVRPHTTKSTCRQPYNYGDVCQQKCADGYELESGNATRTCTEQGVWSGEPVNCTVKRCPALSPPSNGTVIPGPCKSADGVVPGSVCTISCLEGYRVEGNSERTCLTGGHWSGVAARCSVNAAPLLDCPDDITVKTTGGNLSATISWGEPTVIDGKNGTVDFTYSRSNPGTFTEGTHTIVAKGHRDGDSGTCTFHIQVIVPRCPLADETKESGIVYIDCQNHEGATCAAICRPGYLQTGYSNRTCDVIDGVAVWREGNFSCRDIEPPSLSDCIPFTRIVLEKGQDKTNVTISPPVFNDNSGVVTVTKNATLPTSLQPGNHTVVYTGTDGAGLSTACAVVVSVVDLEPPHVPDCMPYREIYSKTSPSGMDIQAPRFTDNVGIIEETAQGNPNSPVSWGSYDITYSALDVSGNVATCKSQVAVIGKTCNDLPDPFNGESVSRVDGKSNLWTIKCTSSFLTLPQFSDYFYNCTQGRWHPTSTAIPCLAKHPFSRVRLSGSFILANLKGRCTDAVYRQQMTTAFKRMLLDRGFQGVCSVYSCKTDVTITCEPEPIALFNTDVESSISVPHDLQTMVDSSTLELRRELINEITFMVVVAVERHEITVVADRSSIQTPQGNCRDGQQLVSGGCVSCPQGTFFNTETRQCVLCPKGTYQPISENLFCRPCPNNTTTDTMGAAHVSMCVGYCQCDSYSYNGLEPCITACPCGAPETRIRTTDGCGTPCTDVHCVVQPTQISTTIPPLFPFPTWIVSVIVGALVVPVLIIIGYVLLKKRRESVPSSAFEQPEDQEESYERLRSNIESSADSGFSGDSAESVELGERQSTYDEIPADGTDSITADDLPDPPEVSRHKAIRQKSGVYTHHLPHLTRRLTEERSQGASDQYTSPIAKRPPPIAKKPLWAKAYKSASTRVTSIGAEPPPDYDTDDDNGDLKLGDYLSMDGQSAKPDGKLGDYLTIGGSGAIPDTKDNEQSEALDDYVKPSAPETKSSIVGEETREASESSSSAVFVPTPRLVTRERTNTYVKHPIQPQTRAPPLENDSH